MINLTKAITLDNIEDKGFTSGMEGSAKDRLLWFRDYIDNDKIYYRWAPIGSLSQITLCYIEE